MGESIPDIVIGVSCFSIFLLLSVVSGGMLQKYARSRNRKALARLASEINGSVESNHKSSWMKGTYQGRAVYAMLTPGLNIAQASDDAIRINSFELSIRDIPGSHDWELALTGMLRKRWTAKSADAALQRELSRSNLVDRFQPSARFPSLRYDAGGRSLHWHEDVKPRLAPSGDQFRCRLDLLLYAADVNARFNPPVA